jgi:hypothetical protein
MTGVEERLRGRRQRMAGLLALTVRPQRERAVTVALRQTGLEAVAGLGSRLPFGTLHAATRSNAIEGRGLGGNRQSGVRELSSR